MSDNQSTSDPTIEPQDGVSDTPATEADDAPPDLDLGTPPGEHASELPGENDGAAAAGHAQAANAEASDVGEPSQ